jgi:hypothetical protein
VNVWHYRASGIDPLVDASAAVSDIGDFYTNIQGIFSQACTGDINFKVYNLVDTPPRTVIYEFTHNITPGTGQGLPNECAICVSYHAQGVSGLPRGRARGRIFLGPLDTTVLDNTVGGAIISAGTTGAINGYAQTLMEAGNPAHQEWIVFSPTDAGPPPWSGADLLLGSRIVVGGYVDDAFDTIRSRGIDPLNRALWPVE